MGNVPLSGNKKEQDQKNTKLIIKLPSFKLDIKPIDFSKLDLKPIDFSKLDLKPINFSINYLLLNDLMSIKPVTPLILPPIESPWSILQRSIILKKIPFIPFIDDPYKWYRTKSTATFKQIKDIFSKYNVSKEYIFLAPSIGKEGPIIIQEIPIKKLDYDSITRKDLPKLLKPVKNNSIEVVRAAKQQASGLPPEIWFIILSYINFTDAVESDNILGAYEVLMKLRVILDLYASHTIPIRKNLSCADFKAVPGIAMHAFFNPKDKEFITENIPDETTVPLLETKMWI